jgi:hypothetical protein
MRTSTLHLQKVNSARGVWLYLSKFSTDAPHYAFPGTRRTHSQPRHITDGCIALSNFDGCSASSKHSTFVAPLTLNVNWAAD